MKNLDILIDNALQGVGLSVATVKSATTGVDIITNLRKVASVFEALGDLQVGEVNVVKSASDSLYQDMAKAYLHQYVRKQACDKSIPCGQKRSIDELADILHAQRDKAKSAGAIIDSVAKISKGSFSKALDFGKKKILGAAAIVGGASIPVISGTLKGRQQMPQDGNI